MAGNSRFIKIVIWQEYQGWWGYAFDNGISIRCFESITIYEKVWFNCNNCLSTQWSTGKLYNNFNNVFISVFSDMMEQNWSKQIDKPV